MCHQLALHIDIYTTYTHMHVHGHMHTETYTHPRIRERATEAFALRIHVQRGETEVLGQSRSAGLSWPGVLAQEERCLQHQLNPFRVIVPSPALFCPTSHHFHRYPLILPCPCFWALPEMPCGELEETLVLICLARNPSGLCPSTEQKGERKKPVRSPSYMVRG